MPQDSLLKALEEEARSQCAAIVEEAEAEARAAVAAAREEAERHKDERFASAKEDLRRLRTSRVNAARTRANSVRLAARHELIAEVFRAALERFKELPRDEYSRLMDALYREAVDESHHRGGDGHVVRVNPADADLFTGSDVEVRPDESVTLGVVVTDPDGRMRAENTVSSRLEKARRHLTPTIDAILFGDGRKGK